MTSLHGRPVDRAGLARVSGDLAAAGGVRLVELSDGAERGIRVLEFRTGSGLCFDVLVDRAMDIGVLEHSGRSIGWRSATGLRHPGLHVSNDEHGLSWLRSFSGFLVTAGLDHAFGPEEVDASGHRHVPTHVQPLHGRVANTPARLLGHGETWTDDGECLLWAEGEVRQASVFGAHLRLVRRIEADLGGNEVRVSDTVTNAGFDRTAHMLLYHVNLGWPLLDEGSRLVAPVLGLRSSTPAVYEQALSYWSFPSPQPESVEQVIEHKLAADAKGEFAVALVNDRLGLGLEIGWSAAELPCFIEWTHLREGAYVVGLEPSTHHREGDLAARADGSMVWLEAGESRQYLTTYSVLVGADRLASTEAAITSTAQQPSDETLRGWARDAAPPVS